MSMTRRESFIIIPTPHNFAVVNIDDSKPLVGAVNTKSASLRRLEFASAINICFAINLEQTSRYQSRICEDVRRIKDGSHT